MPDFESIRRALNEKQAELDRAEAALYAATQKRERLQAKQKTALRQRPGSQSADLEMAKDDERAKRLAVGELKDQRALRLQEYADVADPRTQINRWTGDVPILLLPVRVETRFHRIDDAREELWVRVYPDDCALDTFEETLSESEVASGRRYWIETWAAGGIESQRRAAWRNLVTSHGSGRAAWIVQQFAPVGPEPAPKNELDVRLVIATDAPPSAAEQSALAKYWTALWLAAGNQEAINAATAVLAAVPEVVDAARLIEQFEPANFATESAAPPDVSTVWLVLPPTADLKTRSWTAPTRVKIMPDRFVVLGYQAGRKVFEEMGRPIPSRFVAGPDPSAPAEEQIQHNENGQIVVPENMRWMVDFEQAVAMGMGIKVPLDPENVNLAAPFERVVVLGLRLSDEADEGRERLEELLTHHRYGRSGLAFVPQGTATNNTETDGAGYSRRDDVDASYDALYDSTAQVESTANWWRRPDGQLLADALGINWRVFEQVPHAARREFSEARALNRALWPATFGYAMETMLHPVFEPEQIEATRWFYTHFVSGRGFLPAIRIRDEPYGILPISAVSQWNWLNEDLQVSIGGMPAPAGLGRHLEGLASVLGVMRTDWTTLAEGVSYAGKEGDQAQLLLDVLGLHPTSVEFHHRYAESLDQIFNRAKLHGLAGVILEHIRVNKLQEEARQLLDRLGYHGKLEPDALHRFFFTRAIRINGPLIDDLPLSETDPMAYAAGDLNYIAWLTETARQSFEKLRLEIGFLNNRAPSALLYVMLRHALLLGYWDASLKMHQAANLMDREMVKAARREPVAIHVKEEVASESRYAPLYSIDAAVSGDPTRTVAERIGELLGNAQTTSALDDQLTALDLLKDVPTARLERCLTEHVDTASFRLDSWLLGLVNFQLASQRYLSGIGNNVFQLQPGIHLGAYGWLENLKRKSAPLQPVQPVELDADLQTVFDANASPLFRDPTNGGYIFAPSLNQVKTGAVLRAGYLANATPETPGALAVNLSSARVRVALGLVEGIRNGQPLGALLGYQFQHGLHAGHAPLELDRFVEPLRQQFPLVANQLESTREPGVAIETIEANNVIDGLKLIEHVRSLEDRSFPFGLQLPPTNAAERAAINAEVDRLFDANDALADLALAEGVHQAVLGNYDRVAATYDAYAKGTFPPEPQVVRTPRSGFTMTHRVGLHFDAAALPDVSPVAGIPDTSPRSRAQAMVNKWLAAVLPDPAEVGCEVTWIDPVNGSAQSETVTQQKLALQPIDLLYIGAMDGAAAMGELDDRIVRYVIELRNPRADAVLSVRHASRLAAPMKTFFEVAPLIRHLRSVLFRSRPLAPTDVMLAGEADARQDATQSIDPERVRKTKLGLVELLGHLGTFDPAATDIDSAIAAVVALFERAAKFGLQQVGWGFVYEWRRRAFAGLVQQVQEVITRWNQRLAKFDQDLGTYNTAAAGLNDQQRFVALGALDLLIASMPITPRPANPTAYETALALRRQEFVDKLERFQAIVNTGNPNFSLLATAVRAELPLTKFDKTAFPLEFTLSEWKTKLGTLVDGWAKRLAQFNAELIAYDSLPGATTNDDRFARLENLDRLVAAQLLNPRPVTPAAYAAGLPARRQAFSSKLDNLRTLHAKNKIRLEEFLVELRAELPLSQFDEQPVPLDKVEADVARTVGDLRARVRSLQTEISKRLKAADDHVAVHAAAADAGARVRALQAAGSAFLGEDVRLIPEFTFSAEHAAELSNAYAAHTNGSLLNYLTTTKGIDFPIDDWLHGVARVREKLFAWEQSALLASVFGKPEPALVPIQLPFHEGEGWLALEFDQSQTWENERLLYTGHYAVDPPNPALPTCGLLLDEWTEVVPTRNETAGLAFHFDRPNAEPPQTLMLVTPPRIGNQPWQWSDLLGALEEAFALARLRAVEPGQVDTLSYARFLPATTSAATLYGISIAANYAQVNNFMAHVQVDIDG